ncbi:hypothetical protein RvY_06075-2 [Ramazzottius varieornatus]|uniref:Uncharacterized protein n=1 Tax=Ramazzottius varieornatus TaxID=947166 RepID=A0A1D1V6Y9_RAMVA|nr:hypothetical protein RvY_06075-2 [Ramazzottius varieornatus]
MGPPVTGRHLVVRRVDRCDEPADWLHGTDGQQAFHLATHPQVSASLLLHLQRLAAPLLQRYRYQLLHHLFVALLDDRPPSRRRLHHRHALPRPDIANTCLHCQSRRRRLPSLGLTTVQMLDLRPKERESLGRKEVRNDERKGPKRIAVIKNNKINQSPTPNFLFL